MLGLRPLRDGDMLAVYALYTSDIEIQDVHLQGRVPSLASFSDGIWQGVTAHWAIYRLDTGEPIGLATLASVDSRNGFGYVSVVVSQEQRTIPFVGGEAILLSLDHIFRTFPLRTLYFDVAPRPVYEKRFARRAGRFFDLDGVRRKQVFRDGDFVDMYLLSLSRARWNSFGPQRLARLVSRRIRAS